MRVLIVGAGAAGVFAALRAAELNPKLKILILEAAASPLGKVRISGGGRCNVTHACFDTWQLVEHYPRGGRALARLLQRFGPAETVDWFASRGVKLKTEADGRMFPVTDSSQTVIDCLLREADRLGVRIFTGHTVRRLEVEHHHFVAHTRQASFEAQRLLLAPGGSTMAYAWLAELGHRVVDPVPSLFTFKVQDPRLTGLQGVSLPRVAAEVVGQRAEGPLLITHWGLSGPAILKLSAFAARELHACGYRATLTVDLAPEQPHEALRQQLLNCKSRSTHLGNFNPLDMPKRLWESLLRHQGLNPAQPWSQSANKPLNRLSEHLKRAQFEICGKGVFKEEFVTAGGLPLAELDLDTLESRQWRGLHVAGELLDVDGVTGGFNFQNAWASGWVAGEAIAGGS